MEAQEIWEALLKYDREIVSPRFEDMNKRFDAMVTRDEFNSHMDRIYNAWNASTARSRR